MLTFLPPEKPVNRILKFILMNPRWTLAAVVVATALALVSTVLYRLDHAALTAARTEVASLKAQINAQNSATLAIQEAAKLRAETAEKALEAAREAGKANRQAAVTYLTLPTPAPEQRCDAASDLVNQAVEKNRR